MNPTPLPRDPNEAELDRLRRMYGDVYRIWCTDTLWIGSRRRYDQYEPTVMADTAEQLEELMRHPRLAIGRMSPLVEDTQ